MQGKEMQEFADNLKELKEKRPDKFYELKGIIETVSTIQSGKGINDMLSDMINK